MRSSTESKVSLRNREGVQAKGIAGASVELEPGTGHRGAPTGTVWVNHL